MSILVYPDLSISWELIVLEEETNMKGLQNRSWHGSLILLIQICLYYGQCRKLFGWTFFFLKYLLTNLHILYLFGPAKGLRDAYIELLVYHIRGIEHTCLLFYDNATLICLQPNSWRSTRYSNFCITNYHLFPFRDLGCTSGRCGSWFVSCANHSRQCWHHRLKSWHDTLLRWKR